MAEAKKKTVSKKQEAVSKNAKAEKDTAKTKEGVKDGPVKESNQTKVKAVVKGKEALKADASEQTGELIAPDSQEADTSLAKAGKRSAKALKEAEEKQLKEERKASIKEHEAEDKPAPKPKQRTAEDRLKARSKKYRKALEQVDKSKTYSLSEALELATKTSPVKFDASVEMHIRLNVDPKQADQNIRDTVALPSGTGKTLRIAVFATPEGVAAAKKAGADIAGEDEFLQQLDKGVIDFDVLIATPANMPKLGKYARILGPKGLMPNPKSGTVTNDVTKAVTEAKAGRVEYRVDSTGIIHIGIGKVSFGGSKLLANAQAVLGSIKSNKPASVKSAYVRSIFVTTSMGPSIVVENQAGQ